MLSRPRLSGWHACGLLVALSTAGHAIASYGVPAPWIAPDEITYGLLGRSLWSTGRLALLGIEGSFYGIVYPAFVGLPLELFGLVHGIRVLQLVQPLVMSATGLVVYAWARRLVSDRLALVATAMTLAVPAFAYAGLMMTEVAFYPIATLSLLALARAVERPTLERQAVSVAAILLACLTRLQGLVLLPVLVTTVVVAALFERDAQLIRRFAPTLVLLVIGGALLFGFHETGASRDLLGAYGTTAAASYRVGPALRWIVWHGGVVYLLVAGVPLLASVILGIEALRGRERSPTARALLAVTLSYTAWVVAQVGLFASRFSTVLLERNLITVAPPLFVVFALWLDRGLPRPQPQTAVACTLAAAPALALPVGKLTDPAAAPSAFTTLPFAHVLGWTSLGWTRVAWIAGVVVLLLLAVALPRRFGWTLPTLTLVILVGASAVASSDVRTLAGTLRGNLFDAAPRSWIDTSAPTGVTYVYDGSPYWNGVWIRAFWNHRIDQVAALAGPLPGALPPHDTVSPRFDGQLFTAEGRGIRNAYVLASERITLVGTPVRSVTEPVDGSTLTLWRLEPPARLRLVRTGFQPNGDFSGRAQVDVFGCGQGHLDVTLLGKDGSPVTLSVVDGASRTVAPRPRVGLHVALPAPVSATGSERCTFLLDTPGLVGTTVIAFTPS